MISKEYYLNKIKEILFEKYNTIFEIELLRVEITDDNKEYINCECYEKKDGSHKFEAKLYLNDNERIIEKSILSLLDKEGVEYKKTIHVETKEYIEDRYPDILFTKNYQKSINVENDNTYKIIVSLTTYDMYKKVPKNYFFDTYLDMNNEKWVDYYILFEDDFDYQNLIETFKNLKIMYTFFHVIKCSNIVNVSRNLKKSLYDKKKLDNLLTSHDILLYKKYIYTDNKIREMT